jgi:hypothetical protein
VVDPLSFLSQLKIFRVHESVDMIECFDQQIKSSSSSREVQANGIQPNELEWDDAEESESTEMTPTEIDVPESESLPGPRHGEEEEEYQYDCLQLKDRLTEIDGILSTADRDLSADRSVVCSSLPSLSSHPVVYWIGLSFMSA